VGRTDDDRKRMCGPCKLTTNNYNECGIKNPPTVTGQDLGYPYFAVPQNSIHTEQTLLVPMEWKADQQTQTPYQKTKFYFWTVNNPCLIRDDNCLWRFFDFDYWSLFNTAGTPLHDLTVGFWKWYIQGNQGLPTMVSVRDYFCTRMNEYKEYSGYNSVDFFNGLSFKKINDERDEEGFWDSEVEWGLTDYEC